MRIKCIGCEAMARLIYHYAALSPHIVDVTLFQIGLHNTPNELRRRLQEQIDSVEGQQYDAVILVYGLCGRAAEGLVAGQVPLVMPRAHDCVTLFLGSRQRYEEQQEVCPGTYWYTFDYIERFDYVEASSFIGGLGSSSPREAEIYEEYIRKYGKKKADRLMEVMSEWHDNYERAAYIDMGIGDSSRVEERAREEARQRGWRYESIPGNARLIQQLLDGAWDEDFLVIDPGQRIKMSMGKGVIESEIRQE